MAYGSVWPELSGGRAGQCGCVWRAQSSSIAIVADDWPPRALRSVRSEWCKVM